MIIKAHSPTTIVVASVVLFCCGLLPLTSTSHTTLADLAEKKESSSQLVRSDTTIGHDPTAPGGASSTSFQSQMIHEALLLHEKKKEDAIANQEHQGKKRALKKNKGALVLPAESGVSKKEDDKRNKRNPPESVVTTSATDQDTKHHAGPTFSHLQLHDLIIDGKRHKENKNKHVDEEWKKDKKIITAASTTTSDIIPPSIANVLLTTIATDDAQHNVTKRHGTATASHLLHNRDLIINGAAAAQNAYPWFAKLQGGTGKRCGGSLIKPNWVLTAAHCFYDFKTGVSVAAHYEKTGMFQIEGDKKSIGIAKIFIYKKGNNGFDFNKPRPKEFDIALVCLKEHSKIKPVPYDENGISNGYENLQPPNTKTNLYPSGYGKTAAGVFPAVLNDVEVPYIKNNDCDNGIWKLLKPSMMCAANKNKGTCIGDSGGPLYDPNNKVIVGVLSAVQGDCLKGGIINIVDPDVYTRISSYANWIKETIKIGDEQKPSSSPSELPSAVPSTEPSAEPSPHGPSQSPSPTQTSSGLGPSQSPSPTQTSSGLGPSHSPSPNSTPPPSPPHPSTPTPPLNTPPPSPSSTPAPSPSGTGHGDPHFTTFSGKSFDYHGECDLVMVSSPAFASGSGLTVHLRTTRVDGPVLSYSYISGAVVGIGTDDVLEVQVDGTLVINGHLYYVAVPHEEHEHDREQEGETNKADKDESDVSSNSKRDKNSNDVTPIPDTFATYPLLKTRIGKKKKVVRYVLSLTGTETINNDNQKNPNPITITIHANLRTHLLHVKIDGNMDDAVGLLGHPNAGDRLMGRDGVTDMPRYMYIYDSFIL